MTRDASRAQAAGFNTGDVFAGVGDGQVWRYTPAGVLLQKLETHAGCIASPGPTGGPCSAVQTGMCFDASDNLYATNWTAGTMSKFANSDVPGGQLLNDSSWGSGGFRYRPESCLRDASGHIYTGEVLFSTAPSTPSTWPSCTVPSPCNQIRKFLDDNPGTSSPPPPFATSPAIENQGVDWIDLSSDQCTILYTSEGTTVKSFNVCTGTQGSPDFRTGLAGDCYALRIRANGEVMVTCANQVYRLSSNGTTINFTYPKSSLVKPTGGSETGTLFAMNLDPDGVTFWTGVYQSGNIYRINIATGAQVTSFTAPPQGANPGDNTAPSMAGLAIFGEQTAASAGCITIKKITDPAGGTGFSFGWTGTTTGGAVIEGLPFTLDDGGSEQICDLPPGTYNFGEFQPPPAGWTLTNIVCNGGAGILIGSDSDFDQGDAGVTIPLASVQNVTCTFTNSRDDIPVGGIVELLAEPTSPSAADSGPAPGGSTVFALAAAAAAVPTLVAGAWYGRRRFRHRRVRL